MKTASLITCWLLNVAGFSLLLLGGLFWTGHALFLLPVHILLGAVLVITLWVDIAFALVARVSRWLAMLVGVLSLIMAAFGILQVQLLAGNLHWVIRLVHLAIGVTTVALGKSLAQRIGASLRSPDRPAPVASFLDTRSR